VHIDAEEQSFLWDGLIPAGHITVICGAPAKGKSTLGYRLAADVNVPTLFVTTEESDRTVWRPRVEAAGMDLAKAFHHSEVRFSRNPQDLEHLAELVARYEARLVVVDPLQNHLKGASIHRDDQIRETFEPYIAWLDQTGVSLLLQMHVLRSVNPKHSPLMAVPAGVVSVARAVYLFGDDPNPETDPNIRILACADKFNFGPIPTSQAFEYTTRQVSVKNPITGLSNSRDFGTWLAKGPSKTSAKMLLFTLAPESKERKSDRVAWILLEALREGPLPVSTLKKLIKNLDPPVSWKTAERVAVEMGLETIDDPKDARRKLWDLPETTKAELEEVTEDDDKIVIEEVDLDVPDTVPEDWKGDQEDGS
jgi:hypothetical protein